MRVKRSATKAITGGWKLFGITLMLLALTAAVPDAAPAQEENQLPEITTYKAEWLDPATFKARFTCVATDPDGTVASYALDFGDDTEPAVNATGMFDHSFAGAGAYDTVCSATDNEGGVRTAALTVDIAEGQDPDENILPRFTQFYAEWLDPATLEARFTAQATDPDGQIVSYTINFDDDTAPVTNATGVFVHKFPGEGTYTVVCVATDNDGGSRSIDLPVVIEDGVDPTENILPQFTKFIATWLDMAARKAQFTCAATDPDGQIISYAIDYDDGTQKVSNATGVFIHIFGADGDFLVSCSATDDDGGTRTIDLPVSIEGGGNDPGDDDDDGDGNGNDNDTNNCFISGAAGRR